MKQLIIISVLLIFATLGCSPKNGGTPKMDNTKNPRIGNYVKGKGYGKYSVATFAGGCFWCTEASFERINGVIDVISGYSGGNTEHPTYKEVCSETTGHAEAIQIYFDPALISFNKLLDIFFVAHDPTQLNRQGNDIGASYRSAIYYQNKKQKEIIDAKIKILNESTFNNEIVTEVKAFDEFWVAEEYHQNFYEINPQQSYVYNVSRPKVEKVMKTFNDILKPRYKK
ncbi:peptide-methionine (S)-S-oxide reductase MsrA [bacterium]|nr:peptide-methionine (S)-S-oxide reductase MsrA [bacterium]MDG1435204.1 peptide-methionine (S)-S-oxide reductase MsrA [Saprospiraceae bacterium]